MNKALLKLISLLMLVVMLGATFAGCAPAEGSTGSAETTDPATGNTDPTDDGGEEEPLEIVDYASQVKLDWSSETKKVEATVKTYVDGDTTHFYVKELVEGSDVVKARYLAINTPESTGKIEEWGKAASNFTKSKLMSATSIVLESDDGNWNIDSTGNRVLLWIWYKTDDMDDYRNLNIEILQEGLAIASSSANNRYGEICMAAISQAKAQKLYVYSGEQDPDFFYGDAIELDLKELRTNIEDYSGATVAFNGIITKSNSGTAYVEYYDADTDMYYGISIYYGTAGLSGTGLGILKVGNEVRIVGSVQYYETGGTWQISGLTYREMKPNDPSNIQCISTGNSGAFRLTDANTLVNGTVTIETEEGEQTYSYGELAMSTSISMENLYVYSAYTTQDEESSSYGAISLYCRAEDGTKLIIRTIVLHDENNELVTQDRFEGKTINVKGIVDYYNAAYQIKVFNVNDIEIVG